MAAGITQPGGPGTIIYIYDDSDTGGGRPAGPYTAAQISAAFPADFIDLGTYQKTYRSLVDVQIGDTTAGTATTTWQDTNVKVDWDATFTLKWRGVAQASWNLRLGTKCGSGNQAGGADGCDFTFGADTTMRGNIFLYGSKIRHKGVGRISVTTGITGSFGEIVDSDIQGDVTYNALIIGNSTQKLSNLFNCTFSAAAAAGQPVLGNIFCTTVERLALSAANNLAFIATNGADLTFKDLLMKGTVVQSDLRLNSSGAARWELVRPIWSQSGVPKFTLATAFSITLANAIRERWLYNVKLVDLLGNAVAGIPVKLTDLFGNVVVNTVTDANGRVSFGSGILQNAVQVMDHYGTSGVYIQRHRGPFLEQINVGAGSNPNYFPQTRLFKWPGHETVTLTAGTFEDVDSIIQMDSVVNPTAREDWRPAYA